MILCLRNISTLRKNGILTALRCGNGLNTEGDDSVPENETTAGQGTVATTEPPAAPAVRETFRSTDWTRALLGSDTITLAGFNGPVVSAVGIPWMKIGPDDLPPQGPGAAAARIRVRTVAALGVALTSAALVAGAVGQAWHANTGARQQYLATLPAWSVTRIDSQGLSIVVDGKRARPIRVQVGGSLPNGERLVETDPARNIYRTPSTSVLVRPAVDQPSPLPSS